MAGQTIPLRVTEIRYEAAGVSSYILRREDGTALPCAAPGSHLDLHLPNGQVRSYSISNASKDRGSYRLTVAHKPTGVGSKYLRESVRVGDMLMASDPKNNFPLTEQAGLSIFIAGGIGITPFMPMMAMLNSARRRWRLIYCAKTADSAPFRDEVEQLGSTGFGEVTWHLTGRPGGRRLDLKAAISEAAAGAHFYCCGPNGMLSDFLAATSSHGLPSDQVHIEYFANETEAFTEGGFTVVLHRSGKELLVKPGETILDAVEAAGVEVPQSCLEGLCGSCETPVLEGVPDHRDMVLSERDKQAGRTMMICCSGTKSRRLVLDL
ncbi:PDR/VanB family oxidoreductase [Bradyrhizobium tunisiense]|uniref:PDR/VanB family oxidoreductase n=1 Tax=Bradyrhizobium tunisiense TaxID=3278709 RepID=UPI0035E2AD8A